MLLPRLIDLFRAALEFGAPKKVRLLVEPHPFIHDDISSRR
jgi:hypothetical protein